jgi:hypothetical protein
MSRSTVLSIIILSILGVAVIVATVYLIKMRGKGNVPFNPGISVPSDDPPGEDIWFKGPAYGLQGQSLDVTMVPTPEEETRELVERETLQYQDDLLDPQNPKHAQWEQREHARIQDADPGDGSPSPPTK